MSKRKSVSRPVDAKTIRTAFHNGTLDASKVVDAKGQPVNTGSLFGGPQGKGRGRLNPALVQAFLDANPGTTYDQKGANVQPKTVEVPRVSPKTGRPVKSTILPIAEVRALAGVSGKRGRLSSAHLVAAAEALTAQGR
jgi:hypothetical protein